MAQRKKNRKKCSGRTSHSWTLGCWGLGGCLNHSLCELHKTNTANVSNVEKRCHRLWSWLRVNGRVKKLAIKLRFESCASFLVFNLISINMSKLTPVFKIHWTTASTSLQMCWPHKSFPCAQTIMVNPSVPSRSPGTGRGRQWCHRMIIFCLSVEGKLSFDVLKPRGQVVLPKVQKFDRVLKNHWWTNRRRLSAGSTTCSRQGQQYGSCSSKPYCWHQAQVLTDNYWQKVTYTGAIIL